MSWAMRQRRVGASLPYDPNQRGSDNLTPLDFSSPDRHPIPASAMKESPSATYTPPMLPEYLKNVCDLRPIVGFPKDDEVKGIHAVLRMAHSTTHIPGIFDPELSMNLAQHLFEVQLARHRERYPFGLFPQDVVYTPPTLPSHVAVDLKPVHGIPSDEELQDVHAAVHAYEHVSNVPLLFDPKVEMELSQHLFNIQLARYMSREPERDPEPKSKVRSKKKRSPKLSHTSTPADITSDFSDEEGTPVPQGTGVGDSVESREFGVQVESIG